ncbi:uncharacterized protein LOC129959257 [Argiope bruennichi]|uniref:uncharacterized protein LOC129959257 n=1 Tax=Argiope bruennichi TaxID=94029 RepID=UPI0024940CF0|nr:uncharacterized protein LOC129959257 [Argiope bruennichi]
MHIPLHMNMLQQIKRIFPQAGSMKKKLKRTGTLDLKEDIVPCFLFENQKQLVFLLPPALQENLNKFYDNLEAILHRQNFRASEIYNLDESGITTVHVPPKVIAGKGIKQVGQMTSGERGKLVTIISAVNAIGNSVPPLLVFPRKFFKDHMLKGAPPGFIGAANPSGWSSPQIFMLYPKHFLKHVKISKDNSIILILDNHNTHITIEAIDFYKENGIIVLTLPPHTSHKLEPLDRTVFSSFKVHYNRACSQWMVNHAGRPISIYDVAECVGNVYPLSFTPKNIVSGFQVTGIYPFNRKVFDDSEFLSAFVTDRPIPSTSLSLQSNEESPIAELSVPKTPECVQPFPKAAPRKLSQGEPPGSTPWDKVQVY